MSRARFRRRSPRHDQNAATYIVTVTSGGAFASRQVVTLHPDHSIFVIDSNQETANGSFSSEQGVWNSTGTQFVAHLFDFSYSPQSNFARADYAFTVGPLGRVKGTITLRVFPIKGNPLESGTVIGTFAFAGYPVPN
jgi:D-alanine-D-alanine ligase-like ATP-grasp enzyme